MTRPINKQTKMTLLKAHPEAVLFVEAEKLNEKMDEVLAEVKDVLDKKRRDTTQTRRDINKFIREVESFVRQYYYGKIR